MKSNQFLCLLLLLVFNFFCKKDDTLQITYPSAYYKSGLKSTGDLRVFSSNGEIRDLSVISSFNDKDSSNFSMVAYNIKNSRGTMDSIQFSDAQHTEVIDRYFSINCLLAPEKGRLILTRTDTSIGYSYGDEFTQSPAYYIGQFKPEVFTEYLVSSTVGDYQFGYITREKFILNESGGQLVAPSILFTLHRNHLEYSGYVNNILQNDFYKKISIGDTLTLKEYLILYEK